MWDRFTDRARRVMLMATLEAHRFRHESVGPEHLLLGLVQEGSGDAARALARRAGTLLRVRQAVEAVLRVGAGGPDFRDLPFTSGTYKVIEWADEEAWASGRRRIDDVCLLLGLLRRADGLAARVLADLGVRAEDVLSEPEA